VSDNDDPLRLGRIKARVPDVLGGEETGWARPCFAYAGPQVGLYLIPPRDAMVWIEFEHGEPDYPIWTGCFLREGALDQPLPPLIIDPKKKVLRTGAWTVTLDDSEGGAKLTIESTSAVTPLTRISISQTSIKITNESAPNAPSPPSATIELSGNKVSINGTALEVT
jgi:uncharacterized protein involved in type VI secretion and phage assembly